MDSFSSRLADCLNNAGMKNVHLANEIGVGSSVVGKWLKGDLKPKSDQLLMLARYFDVPMEWLLTGEDYHPRPTVKEAGMAIEREMAAQSPAARGAEEDEEKRRMGQNLNVALVRIQQLEEKLAEANKKIDLARKALKVLGDE